MTPSFGRISGCEKGRDEDLLFLQDPACRRIEHMHECSGERFLIRNVRAEVCGQCGEVFLGPGALKGIDRAISKGLLLEMFLSQYST